MFRSRLPYLCIAAVLLAACSNPIRQINAYKIDIQQGNVLTQEMVAQLKPGGRMVIPVDAGAFGAVPLFGTRSPIRCRTRAGGWRPSWSMLGSIRFSCTCMG